MLKYIIGDDFMNMKISPSMMCAGLDSTAETLRIFENEGIEYLHIDIMDGHFVPNFTLGTDYCREIKRLTNIPLDIHLMIEHPENALGWFPFGEGDIVDVHYESTPHIEKALSEIKKRGALAFVALNPGTPVNALDYLLDDIDGVNVMTVNPGFAGQKMVPAALKKIADVRKYLDERGLSQVEIECDGNVSFENAVKMREAGANIFVAGTSSIFNPALPLADGIKKFREAIK